MLERKPEGREGSELMAYKREDERRERKARKEARERESKGGST